MFKPLATFTVLAAAALAPAHALSTGNLAFTAFNADEDGWSVVLLADVAANTQIFFSDSTATSATVIGAAESSFSWDTGAALLNAGTVVRFSAIDVATRAASVGSLAVVGSGNLGLSASAETVYAYLGSSVTTPTTMLTAVSKEANQNALTSVGLTAGVNALKLTSSADFAGYNGARSGLAAHADYRTLVNTPANWSINVGGDGLAVLPDTTDFSISAMPEPESDALMLAGLAAIGLITRRRA